ncbi:MAG: OmpA family protein [Acidimicrobiales bacterium]
MPSIFDSVTDLLAHGDTASALGGAIGADNETTVRVAQSATPALLGGLADKAKQPGGSKAIMDMLDISDKSSAGGLGGMLSGDTQVGAGMLDGIFGSNLPGVMKNLVGSTGMSSGAIAKLLPMLAPMVMGVLAKRRSTDGLDGAGISNLLAGEQAVMERDGLLGGLGGSIGGISGGTAAAGGAVLGGAAVATGAASKLGGAVASGGGKLGSTVTGSAGKLGDTVTGGAGKLTGAAAGGAGKLGGAVSGGAGKLGGAAAGGAGAIGGAVGGDGRSGGRFGKLGWIIGAVVLVALAAWALSQCGGSDVTDTVTSAAGDAVDSAEAVVDDAAETVEDAAEDAVETVEDAAEEVAETVEETVAVDFQPGIDAAVATAGVAGVAGVIDGDGVVTLTGEAESDAAKETVEAAVRSAEGVTSVTNQITVAAAAPAAGSTINDILDLDPITFAVNSAEITPEGQAVLANAVAFMTANPALNVEIGGHTDSDGSDASNEALSQDRADSVKAFLVANEVDAERMTTKGYGETTPKVDNDTPENRAINRRIEFTIQ